MTTKKRMAAFRSSLFSGSGLLFGPAIAALNRLSYAGKFLIVGILLLAPFGYVTNLMISASDKQIDFNEKERFGVAAITPALKFLGHIERCRLQAIAAVVPWAPETETLEREKRLATALMPLLEALDARYREAFRGNDGKSVPSEALTRVKQLWDEIRGTTHYETATDVSAAYDGLSAAVREWILALANFSNLILDPDLDSYWLMDAFVAKLPTVTADIARSAALSLGHAAESADASRRAQTQLTLAGLYVGSQRLFDELERVNLRTAYDYDAAQGGQLAATLDPIARRAGSAGRAFLETLRTRIAAPTEGAPPGEVLRSAGAALDGIDALVAAVGPELDELIAARVAAYRHDRRLGKLAAEIATFLLVYILIAFCLAMRRSVATLGAFTRRMIAGTAETFRLDSRDELGQVAEMYNDINVALLHTRALKADLEARTEDLKTTNQTLLHEINERKRLEAQLVQAQKLESIGQLAAGIAHEINTPAQYISDNLRFLRDGFADLDRVLAACETAVGSPDREIPGAGADQISGALRDADVPYLRDEIPKALEQAIDGVGRVSEIVRAMKDFSHPDAREREPLDLNRAITTAITIARNEWKYVAEVVTDLDADLPSVRCFAGQLSQALLNIIVNAAHAIAERNAGDEGAKGTITVRTRRDADCVEIRIEDTGAGIPEAARARIFDPFFTTKEVGKGTGQGLAIAYGVVVEKHQGTLRFETEVGQGTTFILCLPLDVAEPTGEPAIADERAA